MSVTTTTPSPLSTSSAAAQISRLLGGAVVIVLDRDRAHAGPACPPHVRPRKDIPAPVRHVPRSRYRSSAAHPVCMRRRSARPAFQFPVPYRHRPACGCKRIAEFFRHCNRPVLPSGAAEADRQVRLSLVQMGRQEKQHKLLQPLEERREARVCGECAATRGSRPSSARRAAVQWGFLRNRQSKIMSTPRGTPRLYEKDCTETARRAARAPPYQRVDLGFQVVRAQLGRVDQVVGPHPDRDQQVDLARDPVFGASRPGPADGGGGSRRTGGSVSSGAQSR